MNFAGFVRHWENPTCQFETVGPPDWLNLWQIENQTHGYVDLALLAAVGVFGDDTNLKKEKISTKYEIHICIVQCVVDVSKCNMYICTIKLGTFS